MRFALVAALFVASCAHSQIDPLVEHRYCGAPKRDAKGEIARRSDVLRVFRARLACPSTERHTGACPGWAIDHVVPLACGGCDAVWNLQWMPHEIKSCAGTKCKDRFERRVYCKSAL